MGKIYMTSCMKGGTGKTVTTYNLAYSLAKMGKKVLAVDFDSQANLTACFGVENAAELPITIGHLMMDRIEDEELPETEEYIMNRNGVDFIPSSMVLSAVDAKLRLEMGAEKMLSGHNRANAAKLAGLSEVPAIVKTELSDEEAYVYVIETNVMQRSFTDLLPSEKAAVLVMRYDKIICQGRRNDIVEEIARLTCGHDVHKLKSRDAIGEEYGMTGRNIGRYMRVNKLIKPLKDILDAGELSLVAAVDVSYLTEEEQAMLWKMVEQQGLKVKPVYAQKLRKESGSLTETRMEEIMETLQAKRSENADVNLKLSKTVCMKYFDGMSAEQMAAVVEQALAAWFESGMRGSVL